MKKMITLLFTVVSLSFGGTTAQEATTFVNNFFGVNIELGGSIYWNGARWVKAPYGCEYRKTQYFADVRTTQPSNLEYHYTFDYEPRSRTFALINCSLNNKFGRGDIDMHVFLVYSDKIVSYLISEYNNGHNTWIPTEPTLITKEMFPMSW